MKESVLYPYPFPCYLVDKHTFKEKMRNDSMWIEDNRKDADVVTAMIRLVRYAVRDQQRVYFSWKDRTMYVQEYL